MGISPKAYNNLQKYLKAGGKIKKADDLQKIYGMDAELLQKLRPYLKIPETKTRSGEEGHPTTNSLPFTKKIEPFEINKATCEEWKSLPGIGDKLSARILKYKSALGDLYIKVKYVKSMESTTVCVQRSPDIWIAHLLWSK